MQLFKLFACFIITFSSSVATFAQGDFFYSFSEIGEGVVNSSAGRCMYVGDSGSLYIYYTTENSDINTGAFLELTTSQGGIINFTGIESFEFDINRNGKTVGHRWTTNGIGGLGGSFGRGNISSDQQQASVNAFTINDGGGILSNNSGPISIDAGYDSDSDAFLFARVDFDVVGIGVANIITAPGHAGVVHDGQTINPIFGVATVSGINLSGCELGDVNRDLSVDLLDVSPFVELLANGVFQIEADINFDDVVDLLDVAPFVNLVTGQ